MSHVLPNCNYECTASTDVCLVESIKHVVNVTSVIKTSPTNETVNTVECAGVDAESACYGTGLDLCTGHLPTHLGVGHGGLRPLKDACVSESIVW